MFNYLINVSVQCMLTLTDTIYSNIPDTIGFVGSTHSYTLSENNRYTTLNIGASEIRNKIIDLLMPTLFA